MANFSMWFANTTLKPLIFLVRDVGVADRVGFEPTEPLQARRISSAVPSTTRPPVHWPE